MTIGQQEKLMRFLQDELMSRTVRQVLIDSFLKKRERNSIEELAAARIAIDLLEDAWKEIERYKQVEPKERKVLTQVGM